MLVDDGLVKLEKVGSVNLYWSFTSDQSVTLNRALKKHEQELQELKRSNLELQRIVDQESVDRVDSVEYFHFPWGLMECCDLNNSRQNSEILELNQSCFFEIF